MPIRFSRRLWLAVCALLVAVGALAPAVGATGPLEASKTAIAHWTQTFEWTIEKSVSPDSWNLETGQSGTSTYTIVVTKSAGTDAVWVSGEVCVKNVGIEPTENLKIVDRLQAIVDGQTTNVASQQLDLSANPVLDPGESHCYPYSIPLTPVPGTTYQNNARITITNDPRDPGDEMGPNVRADFEVPLEPTPVNGAVNVDDTNGLTWLFADSGSVSYTRTFECDRDQGVHDNTATIRETGQSDDARVTVTCTPPQSGGCTYSAGYWKTHSKYGPAKKTDLTWALIGEDTLFFLSGQTWHQVINTPPKGGNAYYILSFQYIAAKLNRAAGTGSTPAVDAAIAGAEAFYAVHTPGSSLSKAVRDQAIAWSDTLASYNEGKIGPGHCG